MAWAFCFSGNVKGFANCYTSSISKITEEVAIIFSFILDNRIHAGITQNPCSPILFLERAFPMALGTLGGAFLIDRYRRFSYS